MTYSSGGLIQATDYNGFVNTTANACVNDIWGNGTGSGSGAGAIDKGYGQTPLATVSASATIGATQWATLVNTIGNIASHQGTSITSRIAPVAGDTITILNNVNTDLGTLNTNRLNASARGTEYKTWSGNIAKLTGTGSGNATWTINFTHTIQFANTAAANYFFNGGGMVRWETSKTADVTAADTEWNDLATTLVGNIYITAGTGTQTIAGSSYTGSTKEGGTGTPTTLSTTAGWHDLTTSNTEIYLQYADTPPYTSQFIQLYAKKGAGGDSLILSTVWTDPGGGNVGADDNISGGTDTTSPFTTFGTAPATLVTYFPPESTYLTNSWGTPTITASIS